MIDVQGQSDSRKVKIKKVGVKGIRHPMVWRDSHTSSSSSTVAEFAMFVELPRDKKGTHMSRFLETLYDFVPDLSAERLLKMTSICLERLEAPRAFVSTSFKYFYDKTAPVSGARGVAEVDVEVNCVVDMFGAKEVVQRIIVPVTSLCPCSKAISKSGAHNQRSLMTVTVWGSQISIAEIIQVAEKAASSALYPVLKREDEKFVTEQAYENPKFVEDLVRDAAMSLRNKSAGLRFEVTAENFESIHTHNVWAQVCSEDL